MTLTVLAAVLVTVGIGILFQLTPSRLTDDLLYLLYLLEPKESLRTESFRLRTRKKTNKIYYGLLKIRSAMGAIGSENRFPLVVFSSLVLFASGVFLTILIRNIWLMPSVTVSLSCIPFAYVALIVEKYDNRTKEALEGTLSSVTHAYIRTNDIISAVKECIPSMKMPVRGVFEQFVNETTYVSADTKKAIRNLRKRIDDPTFREWCDMLLLCQNDGTLRGSLVSIVSKLSNIRIVNAELKTDLQNVRTEYWIMAVMVVSIIPILRLVNIDWFEILLYSLPGKMCLGLAGSVIVVTAFIMKRITRPLEYKE